jgi:hypothetical protein
MTTIAVTAKTITIAARLVATSTTNSVLVTGWAAARPMRRSKVRRSCLAAASGIRASPAWWKPGLSRENGGRPGGAQTPRRRRERHLLGVRRASPRQGVIARSAMMLRTLRLSSAIGAWFGSILLPAATGHDRQGTSEALFRSDQS